MFISKCNLVWAATATTFFLCSGPSSAEEISKPIASKSAEIRPAVNLKSYQYAWIEDDKNLVVLSDLALLSASFNAAPVQYLSSGGISLSLNIDNPSGKPITVENSFNSLKITLKTGDVITEIPSPRWVKNAFTNKNMLFMPFTLQDIKINDLALAEQSKFADTIVLPAHSKMVVSLIVGTIWPEPEWKKQNPFSIPSDAVPYDFSKEKLPPTQEKDISAGTYQVAVSFRQTASKGVVLFYHLNKASDFLKVELLKDNENNSISR